MTEVVEKKVEDRIENVEVDMSQANEAPQGLQLVGQGKQYKTVEDLEKGKVNADNRLNELKAELEAMKSQMTTLQQERDAVIDKLAALDVKKQPVVEIDEGDIISKIEAKLNAKRNQEMQEANLVKVNTELKRLYGEKVNAILDSKAQKLNVTKEELSELAAKHPEAALKLLIDSTDAKAPGGVVSMAGSVRTDGITDDRVKMEYKEVIKKVNASKDPFSYQKHMAEAKRLFSELNRDK